MSYADDSTSDRTQPWAPAFKPWRGLGDEQIIHGEIYLFGSLAIVSIYGKLIIAHTSWTARSRG